MRRSTQAMLAGWFGAVVAGATACEAPFPEPAAREYGTFGEEMYRLVHREFLWSGTAEEGEVRAAAFASRRDETVWAFERLPEGAVETGMLPLLEKWLPLYEAEAVARGASIPTLTRDLAVLVEAMRDEPRLAEALASASARPRTVPDALLKLAGAMARHETAVLDRALAMAKGIEGDLTSLLAWASRELAEVEDGEPRVPGERSLVARLMDLELESGQTEVGPPVFAARIDGRGAWVVPEGWQGAGHPGLRDGDGDGLPDVDGRGRFVDAEGGLVGLEPLAGATNAGGANRDAFGRASLDGVGLFEYVDLRKSLLAFVLRDARKLVAKDAHFDLFTTVHALIGEREERQDADGTFMGFRVSQSPLLDVVHALNELRRYPRLAELTRAMEHIAVEREGLLRQLAKELARALEILEGAPELTGGMKLVEDFLPVLGRLAEHGGLRALMATAGAPEIRFLAPSLVTMMSRSELNLPVDMDVLQVPGDVDALTFRGSPDWSGPDRDDASRSWLQKATWLIADTDRAPAFLVFLDLVDVPEIAITDDMASLYMEAIAGRARLDLGDEFLENLTIMTAPEFDDLMLSAEELNLFMNHDQAVLGNPRGNRGVPIRESYGPALLALQASRSLEALRPWVTRVVDAGHTRDLVEVFVTLARHYGEESFTVPGLASEGTGFRRMEPSVIDVLTETGLVGRTLELAAWMHSAEFDHGGLRLNVADEVDAFVRWVLADDASLRTRTGLGALPSARGGQLDTFSRAMLIVKALESLDAALDEDPAARAAWERVDLLGTFVDLDARGEFVNPHFLDLVVAVIPVLADHLAEAVARPSWSSDVAAFVPDLTEFVGSRGFAALVDIVSAVRDQPAWRSVVDDVTAMALAEVPARADADVMAGLLRVASSLAHDTSPTDVIGPAARAMATFLAPERRSVMNLVDTLIAMRADDAEQVTDELVRNLLLEPEPGRIPLVGLLTAFEFGLRDRATGGTELSVDEWREVLAKLASWLRDEDRGAERLYRVILAR